MRSPLEMPYWLPVQAKDLIGRLLRKDEASRPSLEDIANHPFFHLDIPYFCTGDALPEDLDCLQEDVLLTS